VKLVGPATTKRVTVAGAEVQPPPLTVKVNVSTPSKVAFGGVQVLGPVPLTNEGVSGARM